MFTILVGNYLRKKQKDKFTSSTESSVEEEEGMGELTMLANIVGFIIVIYSLYLFFKCYNLKKDFSLLEFIGSLCYPLIYIIWRLIFSPEIHCKDRLQEAVKIAMESSQQVKKIDRANELESEA